MVEPVDGKVIRPYADHMWARSVDNDVKLIRIEEHTCTFLDIIDGLHKAAGLKLVDVHFHSVLFPELFFKDDRRHGYVMVFYEDECWNIQTGPYYLNSKVMREAVIPFLEFLDKYAIRVDYKMVKKYLGLKDEEDDE